VLAISKPVPSMVDKGGGGGRRSRQGAFAWWQCKMRGPICGADPRRSDDRDTGILSDRRRRYLTPAASARHAGGLRADSPDMPPPTMMGHEYSRCDTCGGDRRWVGEAMAISRYMARHPYRCESYLKTPANAPAVLDRGRLRRRDAYNASTNSRRAASSMGDESVFDREEATRAGRSRSKVDTPLYKGWCAEKQRGGGGVPAMHWPSGNAIRK